MAYTSFYGIDIDDHWKYNTLPILLLNLVAGTVFYPIIVFIDWINYKIFGGEKSGK